MSKFSIGVIILVVLLGGGLFYVASHKPAQESQTLTLQVSVNDHATGTPNAKVTLLEYGDFQCPACGQYFPLVEQIRKDFSGKILFVFRNFPLYQIHPN